MSICRGPVKSKNSKSFPPRNINEICLLCSKSIQSSQSKLTCLNSNCDLITHITCLADLFLSPGDYLPIEGDCPFCGMNLKWGDLIQKMKRCSQDSVFNPIDDRQYSDSRQEVSDDEATDVKCNSESKQFKIRHVEDEQPSWFMDVNDDL